MKVKFKKLSENAVIPVKGSSGAAGFDMVITSMQEVDYYHTGYGFGLAVEIPRGYVGLVFPRSSVYKHGMLLTNSVGVIDSDYRGEIRAVFLGVSDEMRYKVGERACQMVIVKIPEVEMIEVEELSETERGVGGFGSTGDK